eukprot:98746_1
MFMLALLCLTNIHIVISHANVEIIMHLNAVKKIPIEIPRPSWAGPVLIKHENKTIHNVEGIIIPMDTRGRDQAPDPLYGKFPPNMGFHRGHIMALQLGGPDISQNIVTQNGDWQAFGEWRHLEKYLYRLSKYVMDMYDSDDFGWYYQPRSHDAPNAAVYLIIKPSNYDVYGQPQIYNGEVKILHRSLYNISHIDFKRERSTIEYGIQPIHFNAYMVRKGHIKIHQKIWREYSSYLFKIEPNKHAVWSPMPPDWKRYVVPGNNTVYKPIWNCFGIETQQILNDIFNI